MTKLREFEDLLIDVLKCARTDLNDENGPDQIANWDSITHMEMVSKIEEVFNIQLDIDEINQIETIGKVKEVLKKHGLKL